MELEPLFKYGLPALMVLTMGLLGRTRRIGFWGAIITSVLLTPVGGFLIALASGERSIQDEAKKKPPPARVSEPKTTRWFGR